MWVLGERRVIGEAHEEAALRISDEIHYYVCICDRDAVQYPVRVRIYNLSGEYTYGFICSWLSSGILYRLEVEWVLGLLRST
jgi:hypothetical protein